MEMIHETWLHIGARKLFVVVTMNQSNVSIRALKAENQLIGQVK